MDREFTDGALHAPRRWAIVPGMRALPLFAAALLLAASLGATAAPPLAEADQNALDRAVIDYEAGRLAPAQSAFEALAARGLPAAQFNLAVMHLRRELPDANVATARRWLLRAAEGGFVTAQVLLAQALENGDLGARDLPLALHWYEVAATGGSVDAKVAMGTAFYLGRGVAKSPADAARWFREAAAAGDVGAQYLLASMYEQGDGVARDLRLARYWYGIAAQNGDEAAPGKVKELDAQLAPAQAQGS